MPILALDTASLVSSVALATANTLVAELTLQTTKTHSELLMPHIAQLLNMTGVDKRELKAIAVSSGPGSFTGLRIGLATAKALAYALHIPVIGVPTLTAQVCGLPAPGLLLSPVLDAQKGNVYQGLYRWQDGALQELQPVRVVNFADLLTELATLPEPVMLLGEAAAAQVQAIAAAGGQLLLAQPHLVTARAANVAIHARSLLLQGITQEAMHIEPMYIRRPEAEELWEKRHNYVEKQ